MLTSLNTAGSVVLVIGVNGGGKDDLVGKLAGQLKDQGRRSSWPRRIPSAPAAIEQLTEWATRARWKSLPSRKASDPAAVVYDAVAAAKSRQADVLICDTAGRLHNKKNLMEELKKINRIIDKEYPDAYRETRWWCWTEPPSERHGPGQTVCGSGADFQELFSRLHGTAKGGNCRGDSGRTGISVKYVGIGEKDRRSQAKFNADDFVNALFQTEGK